MKKIILLTCCILLLFTSCNVQPQKEPDTDTNTDTDTEQESETDEIITDHSWYSKDNGDNFSFHSIADLKRYFRGKDASGNHIAVVDPIYERYANYQKFVDTIIASGNIFIPYINGEEIAIQEENGYAQVFILPYGSFKQPWLGFHCAPRNRLFVDIMYIPEEHLSKDYIASAAAFTKNVAPDYPNLENAESHENIESVYETQLVLSDRTVTALVYKYHGDARLYYNFIYDNLLIRVVGYRTEAPDTWFKGLSFAEIPIS